MSDTFNPGKIPSIPCMAPGCNEVAENGCSCSPEHKTAANKAMGEAIAEFEAGIPAIGLEE